MRLKIYRKRTIIVARNLRFTIALLLLNLFGCDKNVPQKIHGRLLLSSIPIGNTEVRLYGPSSCKENYETTTTDADGYFSLPSRGISNWAQVHIQELSLCLKHNETWEPIWNSTHDGAVKQFKLDCDLSRRPRAKECVAKMYIDGE